MVRNRNTESLHQVLQGPSPNIYPTGSTQQASPAKARLSLISRHLEKPGLALNTPFSREKASLIGLASIPAGPTFSKADMMSIQVNHPTLLIPGPVEFDDEVLQSMAHYRWVNQFSESRQYTDAHQRHQIESHVGPSFVSAFGEALSMLRKLFITSDPTSQPFVVSGSGTLGWDFVASNLVERGDDVLVLHSGYFGDSFADCFQIYGINTTQLKAPIGSRPQLPEIEQALKEKNYAAITITHVDTSTGVLSDVKAVSELVHRVSPDTLVIVDGVCSVGSEEIRFDEWKLDVVLTASQKAIGVPAGLCILMVSGRAIDRFNGRKTLPSSYFASFKNWLPIMKNYEAKKPSYFATPSPQLIRALHTSLSQILSVPLEERFTIHKLTSQKVKRAITDLGLKQLAERPENQANSMTAIYLPEDVKAPELLPNLFKRGIVFAGGLHKQIATKYIRFGHMGVSVTDPSRNDIDKAIEALKDSLADIGYQQKQ
ncbi:hypothetical protein FGG08_001160 [Glutinoglossum americanum]|uniref:alanine--glyoxylate transaminase n=1 Tax=Glutinoglossum americanum TaxID=1670608 RepID=A0A9P8IBP9_9PEZI|nr:hypothetical protein FGG08_001160 [Glutinoglossum americanum]